MKTTLSNLTSTGGRSSWEVVYTQSGLIKSSQVAAYSEEDLANRIHDFFDKKDRQFILTLRLKKGLFKSKCKAAIYDHHRVKSLSLRHNLNVFLRNSYSNGDEICKEMEALIRDEDREEHLRTYHIEEKPQDLWFVLKQIKTNIQTTPVLLSFNSAGRSWEDQREFWVEPLVDYSGQILAMEFEYNADSPNKAAMQEIFVRFKVRRVPSWLMVTPVKRKGKANLQITRFDQYRETYFARQAQKNSRDMDLNSVEDVKEAFSSFILWGLKQVIASKPSESISL